MSSRLTGGVTKINFRSPNDISTAIVAGLIGVSRAARAPLATRRARARARARAGAGRRLVSCAPPRLMGVGRGCNL